MSGCQLYAMPLLQSIDQNPSGVLWLGNSPRSAVLDGERMVLTGTFLHLEHEGLIKIDKLRRSIAVTDAGKEALRAMNVRRAGI